MIVSQETKKTVFIYKVEHFCNENKVVNTVNITYTYLCTSSLPPIIRIIHGAALRIQQELRINSRTMTQNYSN